MKPAFPKWATPERRRYLVELFERSGGFCVRGERPCTSPLEHHYSWYIEPLIADWKASDSEDQRWAWLLEQRAMHRIPEKLRRGRFDSVAQDAFGARQPSYYTEGFTVNAFTFTRMAKVRIPSTHMRLFVDVPKLSKNKRRKLKRYQGIDLHAQLQAAVQDFWTG